MNLNVSHVLTIKLLFFNSQFSSCLQTGHTLLIYQLFSILTDQNIYITVNTKILYSALAPLIYQQKPSYLHSNLIVYSSFVKQLG